MKTSDSFWLLLDIQNVIHNVIISQLTKEHLNICACELVIRQVYSSSDESLFYTFKSENILYHNSNYILILTTLLERYVKHCLFSSLIA